MPEEIISLDRIKAEAKRNAAIYADLEAACPYPWGSTAAIEFKREFLAERSRISTPQAESTNS